MKVIMVSPEVTPFAKTGGLADVVGTLPKYLFQKGVQVSVILPLYKIVKNISKLENVDATLEIPILDKIKLGKVKKSFLPETKVPVYFIEQDEYYNRDNLYTTSFGDYPDNCERFIFFSRAVLEFVKYLDFQPDIIHCHDWQTGLIPLYMKTLYAKDFSRVKSIMTIHNLAFQGLFWHLDMPLTGLDWKYFNWQELEFYGKINFLKGGLVFADAITTVSKTYAKEIKSKEFGCGLEGVIQKRSSDLYGILNGADYTEWNPQSDKFIKANYGIDNLFLKGLCKNEIQKKCHLPQNKDIPLIGIIGRLTEQKGINLVVDITKRLVNEELQLVILGTGDKHYEEILRKIGKRYPQKISVNIVFDNKLSHEIMAGADMLLVASHFEPCGLTQLYSMKYGTVPIVRAVGGLADTVTDYGDTNSPNNTGFVFTDYTSDALFNSIKRAINLFRDKKRWQELQKNCMQQDWSWEKSTDEYIKLYNKVLLRLPC